MMDMIRVLIVEDKLLIAEDIASRLRKHEMDIAGICRSGEEAIQLMASVMPDLVLMDIELAGAMDGISTAHLIHQQYGLPVIYLSDYTDVKTLERAKKTQPVNYLTKPFNEGDLVRAIDFAFSNANLLKAWSTVSLNKNYVFLKTENQVFVKFLLNDILCLKAGRSYCDVITATKAYTLSSSMNHIHDQLNSTDFIKVHRSFVVNVNRISSIEGNSIKIGQLEVQMSPDYREALLKHFKIIK